MPYRFLKSQQNAAASEAATKEFWGGLERVFVGPGHKPMDREEIIAVMRTQRQVLLPPLLPIRFSHSVVCPTVRKTAKHIL